jgi:hypothetical protein
MADAVAPERMMFCSLILLDQNVDAASAASIAADMATSIPFSATNLIQGRH